MIQGVFVSFLCLFDHNLDHLFYHTGVISFTDHFSIRAGPFHVWKIFVNIISTKIDQICPWEWVQYLTVDALQYFIFKLCPFPEHYRIHVPCVCLCGWILMVRLIVQRLYNCHSSCPWLNCRETICKYWSKHSSLTDTAQVQL